MVWHLLYEVQEQEHDITSGIQHDNSLHRGLVSQNMAWALPNETPVA